MSTINAIQEMTSRVLDALREQNYSDYTVGRYDHCYHNLLRYAEAQGITQYSEQVGLDYLKQKYGLTVEGFFGTHPQKVRSAMRSLQVLWDYTAYGTMVVHRRPPHQPFVCPAPFAVEYDAFQAMCRARAYTPMGTTTLLNVLHRFLVFLDDQGLAHANEMRAAHLTRFLESFSGCSTRYIATVISTLRNYLTFLYIEGFLPVNLSLQLPKVRVQRHALIPASWTAENVTKLLAAIDRHNPQGKRDYAILLMVVQLGLRVSDIRALTLNNLDWSRKCLSIIMTKTKRLLELPLLDDVGWALIDYLQHGRPATTAGQVFVRHRAPYDGFAHHDNLERMLQRHMHTAGITMAGQKHGLHSLRSTLARTLLETGATLPVIAGVLGHQSVQTSRHYLAIDLDGLRQCALDPDQVLIDGC